VAGPTHYERLGVRPDASTDEIRAAYRQVARVHHPDAAGSAAGADMAAVNEAWRVLSDPGRRALYDRTLTVRSAGGAPQAARVESAFDDDLDDDLVSVTRLGRADSGRRFPIWPFVLLFVLGAIFIFTVGALSDDPQPLKPDNLLFPGSCVAVEADRAVHEVGCEGPNDGVVVTVVNFDDTCPSNTESHRDRQGRGWACITPS
jgi:molecular chaperone DnaJ